MNVLVRANVLPITHIYTKKLKIFSWPVLEYAGMCRNVQEYASGCAGMCENVHMRAPAHSSTHMRAHVCILCAYAGICWNVQDCA